jgi:GTP cyclohydrolase IB
MYDVQNEPSASGITIDKVGVKNLSYPITVRDRAKKIQHTVGSINMYVNLPHQFRGTHMSRFIEILNEFHREIHLETVSKILIKMKEKLHAQAAHMSIRFPYFMEKTAPVSGAVSMMEYMCTYIGNLKEKKDFIMGVEIPVNSLCPCSKEIADTSAHNQRSIITIQARFHKFVWIEELIEIAESSASSPLFALLKRKDEKFVTEYAYEHPRFVEDMVRLVAEKLNQDSRIEWYNISSENYESIHNHSAYASVECDKTKKD